MAAPGAGQSHRFKTASAIDLHRGSAFGLFGDDSPTLVDSEELVRGNIGDLLAGAARPLDFEGRNQGVPTQAKCQSQIALRAIARSAADDVPLLAGTALDAHDGTNAVAVRFSTHRADGQPMVAVPKIVAVKIGRTIVGSDEKVEIAVAIDIGVGRTAGDDRARKLLSNGGGSTFKLAIP
jgi:hypothetical protein